MTSFDLFEAVGDIPEEMLEELDRKNVRSRRNLRRAALLSGAAACIAAVVLPTVYHFGDDTQIAQPETISPETGEAVTAAAYQTAEPAAGERNADHIYPAAGGVPETGTVISVSEKMLTEGDIYGYPYDPDESAPVYTTYYDPEENAFFSPGYDPANPGEPGLTAAETAEVSTTMNMTTAEPFTVPELPEYTGENITGTYIPEVAVIPGWEDMDDMERYTNLEFSGTSYSVTDDKFDLSELTYIGWGEMWGYDAYSENNHCKDDIGVYAIDGINPEYMTAVLTADGKYTGFENYLYSPDTLWDYLADTDFERRHFPAKLYSGDAVSAWEHMEYDFPGLEEQVKILLEAGREAEQVSVPPPDFGVSILSMKDSSGEYVMTIYGGGCIVVMGKIFNVGEENTELFINTAERFGVKSELVPYGESAGGQTDIVPE